MKIQAWKTGIFALLPIAGAITACSQNAPSPTSANTKSASSTPAAATASSTTRPAATSSQSGSSSSNEECSLAASIYGKAFKPGDSGPTPANFPPPPTGAQLCGSTVNDVLGTIVIYTSTQSADQIVQYYKTEAEKRGFQAQLGPTPPGASHPDLRLSILRNSRKLADVNALGNKQVFQIEYPK